MLIGLKLKKCTLIQVTIYLDQKQLKHALSVPATIPGMTFPIYISRDAVYNGTKDKKKILMQNNYCSYYNLTYTVYENLMKVHN